MEKRELKLKLNTPGFIGNASQQAQWRTPPLKALLRFWWRIAVAAEIGREKVGEIRKRELELFGSAGSGKDDSHRSRVLFRLNSWDPDNNRNWSPAHMRSFENVKIKAKKPYKGNYSSLSVRADAYLGFGPLRNDKQKGVIFDPDSDRTALPAGALTQLTLGIRGDAVPALERALSLAAQFGTLGGRSNNAWGSLSIDFGDESPIPVPEGCIADLEDCRELPWPAALGRDEDGPLVWETGFHNSWESALSELALLRRFMREACEVDSRVLSERHLTGYPITGHNLRIWDKDEQGKSRRLPDQIRFKVMSIAGGRYWGRIYHLPHGVPQDMPDRKKAQALLPKSWRKCHEALDSKLARAEMSA